MRRLLSNLPEWGLRIVKSHLPFTYKWYNVLPWWRTGQNRIMFWLIWNLWKQWLSDLKEATLFSCPWTFWKKNTKNIWKLNILTLCSSNLAVCCYHLESCKIHWKPSPIPRDSDLMGVRCRLELGVLNFPQVILKLLGVTSFHPKSTGEKNLIYHTFVIQH